MDIIIIPRDRTRVGCVCNASTRESPEQKVEKLTVKKLACQKLTLPPTRPRHRGAPRECSSTCAVGDSVLHPKGGAYAPKSAPAP